jgi:hypothetical protein
MGSVKLIHILLLGILFSFYNCQQDPGEEIFSKIKVQNIKTHVELESLKNTTDMTYFVYYYKKTSKTSRMIAPILIQLANKLEHIAEILIVDCDQETFKNVKYCEHTDQTKDVFPRMMVLVAPEFRFNPYTKKLNHYTEFPLEGSQVSESILFNFITKYVLSRATKLTSSNIDTFLK